jgi:hypothetical protein
VERSDQKKMEQETDVQTLQAALDGDLMKLQHLIEHKNANMDCQGETLNLTKLSRSSK